MTQKTIALGGWNPPLFGAIYFRSLANEQTCPAKRKLYRKWMRARALDWKAVYKIMGVFIR